MKNSINSFVNLADVHFNVTLPFRLWEVGCTIHIPQTISPMQMNFGDTKMPRYAVFIPVQIEYPDGMVVNDKLFLATLNKCLQGFDEAASKAFLETIKSGL